MASLIKKTRGKKVFLDTAIFIYTFEDNPNYSELTSKIFDDVTNERLSAVSSVITVSEVLTKPYELKRNKMVKRYQEVLTQMPNLEIANIDYEVSVEAAKIRARYNFRLIDAYQLAVAKHMKCRLFLTNDKQLMKYNDVEVLYLSNYI